MVLSGLLPLHGSNPYNTNRTYFAIPFHTNIYQIPYISKSHKSKILHYNLPYHMILPQLDIQTHGQTDIHFQILRQ